MEELEKNEEQQLKTLVDITDGKPFVANGKTYYQESALSIDRWVKMNEFTIELGFGVTYEEMQQNWLKQLNLLNKMDFVNSAVMAHNMVNGISRIYTREPIILKFCALFMNTADEDRGTITDEQISVKIDDWKKEGLGIDGFFVFSLLNVKNLAENFQNANQTVSNLMAESILKTQTATK